MSADEPKREELGKMVRSTWISWALSFPDPKPSWLDDWDKLTESQKEVDRLIGTRIYLHALEEAKAKPEESLKALEALRGEIKYEVYKRLNEVMTHLLTHKCKHTSLDLWRERFENKIDELTRKLIAEAKQEMPKEMRAE